MSAKVQKKREHLKLLQERFGDTLKNLFGHIGLQKLPQESTIIRLRKGAFELKHGQKYLGLLPPENKSKLLLGIQDLEKIRAEILTGKKYFGYTGTLAKSYLSPVIQPIDTDAVTLSVIKSQRVIPLTQANTWGLVKDYPHIRFFEKLYESRLFKHIGRMYETTNYRYALRGQKQRHINGGIILILPTNQEIQLVFRLPGGSGSLPRADKIAERPFIEIQTSEDGESLKFYPKSTSQKDLEVFKNLNAVVH